MPRSLTINGRQISDDSDCYLIAEIGCNHMGDVENAKKIISRAKEAGASAVKLQKRDNRALFTKEMFDSPYVNENSFGDTYGLHRQALEFERDDYAELQRYAEDLGVTLFATPFDFNSVDFLADLNVPAFKTASGDITNTPMLKHIAQIGKPMIVSTGGASMEDVERAHDAIAPINSNFCILQCTSAYPALPEDMNLKVIETYRGRFPDTVIGLSDHQNGIAMALVGYMLGARVIEKHFTLNRTWKGTDQPFSLETEGLRKLVRDLERTKEAMGDGVKRQLPKEEAPLYKMAKKLVAAHEIPAGHVLTRDDIAIKSPNDGLPPYELDKVLGKKLLRPLGEDENIAFADLAGA